ncbi:transcription termination factor MTERF15, mitochondrial-like [Telopea speciosissima]|uniref:transcription termination factor MTERF15, mitochondrial-like n=1 Tax=Telopea speciosissima TaxID=54955 RepID=UPI001CC3553C|nr:transcription termination factor MTERF15, mitochondrial-like [Telopea speciosissima]
MILTLFRNHGFTETQISMLIRKCPTLLLAKPTETLLPKLEFFHSVGVQNSDLAKILSRDPGVLYSSLENQIIPAFIFFKSLVGTVENVVIALKRQTRFLKCDMQNLARNIGTLRENGVPESNILTLLTYYPKTITPKNDRFKQRVGEIKQMGFDPSRCPFVIALVGLSSMNESTWKQKLEAFGSWGLSKDDTVSAFRKYPWCMLLSEKKIMGQMDFLLNKMGWELADIMRTPQILGFSLEKRVIPRCSVLRVLQLKGLVERDQSIGSVLIKSNESFMEKFVKKYEKEVPQLLDVYKGKIGLPELGYGSEEVSGRKLL